MIGSKVTLLKRWLAVCFIAGLAATIVSVSVASDMTGNVEILRDTWGIPHIFSKVESYGFYGLGYACAQDRLLQMELIRRKAAGRLAEVFGKDWITSDRTARIAGHAVYASQAFGKLPGRWQEALKAYAAGVNAWVEQNPDAVSRRFEPLGIAPQPWTPVDCLVAKRGVLSLGSPFGDASIKGYRLFRDLVARVGEAEANRQSSMMIDDGGAIVMESDMAKDAASYSRLKERTPMKGYEFRSVGNEPRKMSHAWAVSGERSTTGKPILENDPQLPLSTPPFFYEFHLAAGEIDARGLGIPGCPGLFVGFNNQIAWGASSLGVDSFVEYIDMLTPDGKSYIYEGKAIPFDRRLEKINVKDEQPVIQEVLTNRHGTVFNSLVASAQPGEALLSYDAETMDAGTSVLAMLEVMSAGTWAEFRRALEYYYYPGIHVVYADVAGNIGYQTLVNRPLTAKSPRRAFEGWTGQDEITSRIPLDEMPHMLNPASGYISHANNLPVGSWYPHDLGLLTGGTGDTGRSLRLRQLLAGDKRFSVDDFENLVHRDDVNAVIAALLPVARKVVEEDRVTDKGILKLLESLEGWDLRASSQARYPTAAALANAITPYRRAGLNEIYGPGGGGVAHLARDLGSEFDRNGRTPTEPLVRAYLVNWLKASAAASAPKNLNIKRTITIGYQKTSPIELPVIDSSLDIVSPALTVLDEGTIWSQPGNLYSQIVDLSDIDNSRSMIAPGNAEDATDPNRTNQIALWVDGCLHPAPLSRNKVASMTVSQLNLTAERYDGPMESPELVVVSADPRWRFIPAIP